jgi:hypothetical protein
VCSRGVLRLMKSARVRHLRSYPANTHAKTLDKMPFISELIVFSQKSVNISVNGSKILNVDRCDELLKHRLLISDPKIHFLGHENISVALANNTLFIDCTERQARTLGITFSKMIRYTGKDGMKRAYYSIDLEEFKNHPRLSFSINQLFLGGSLQCIVPCKSGNAHIEDSLNIDAPAFPVNPSVEDVALWAGLVAINATGFSAHTETSIDFTKHKPMHVYRVKEELIEKEFIERIINNENVKCVVGISARAVTQYADDSHPTTSSDIVPPTSFITWRSERGIDIINYS